MPEVRFRAATPRDSTAIARLIRKSTASYANFAPPGWHQRTPFREEAEVHDMLSRGNTHARLAVTADENLAVAFAGWRPATTQGEHPEPIPGRAHIFAVFVVPEHWGTGLAGHLLDWIVTGMRDSGFDAAQLWTPRDHLRARAFYERNGWSTVDERAMFSPELGLELVFYERPLA
jgi:GNAT superfamily N-acetyltransferase